MSVLVTMRVAGDTEQFRRFTSEQGDVMRRISDDARARGCIHHRFGVGDGFVLVVDEWESAEKFQAFFEGNEEIEQVMRDSGAQGEPEFSFSDAIETVDQF
jgi:heme-degrading monooxygenase HmoA